MFLKELRARDRTGNFAVFIPLSYDGLIHAEALEKGLPLTSSLKTTYTVQSFLGWLTLPSPFKSAQWPLVSASPSFPQADTGAGR